MERRFSVWALAALMVLAVSVVPAGAQHAAWDSAAQNGAYFLELFAVGGIVGPATGPPVPVSDSDTVDSPVIAGDWAGGVPGWFDDWGCIALALRAGEALGYPTLAHLASRVGPPPNLAGDVAGNYSVDDAIELGSAVVWPSPPAPGPGASGLDDIFPVVGGVPTHGSARPLDLAFLAQSAGVGSDGVPSNARAAVQWGEMKGSAAAAHNPVAGWRSAVWGDFSAYASLAALGGWWNANNTAWGVAQLANFGQAISLLDPPFLAATPTLSAHLEAALTSLTAGNCDPLYYFALGLAVREFARENDIARLNAWVPVLLAGAQVVGPNQYAWFNPTCPPTTCDKVLNTAGAMIGLDAVSESFYATHIKNGGNYLVATQVPTGPSPSAAWCVDERDQWPTLALMKLLEDNTAPSVVIDSPVPGQTICCNSVTIQATVTDNVDVQKVEFYLNGALLATDTTAPFEYVLDTHATSDCDHLIEVWGYDYAGHLTKASAAVVIDNTPPVVVKFNQPATALQCVSGTFIVDVDAADSKDVCAVEFGVAKGANPVTWVYTDTSGPPWTWTWDTTDTMGGIVGECTHTLYARAKDCCYPTPNVSANLTIQVRVDNTGPTVSLDPPMNTETCLQDTETFVVTATDAKCGVAQVEFTLGSLSNVDTSAPYSWTVNTNALPDGAVTLTYKAKDNAGNYSSTGTKNYKVNNQGPSVAITAPGAGAIVSGASVTLSATASDADWSVKNVKFYLDSLANLIATDPIAPYNVLWDSTTTTDGAHTIIAVATDNSDVLGCGVARTSQATRNIVVDNTAPPAPTITSPASGATVCGVVNVNVTATDPGSGIKEVAVYLDSVAPANLLGVDTTSPYTVVWNTALTSNGAHNLIARATDNLNQSTNSAPLPVTVDNASDPVVTWTNPLNNTDVSGTVNLQVTATDPNGVTKVEFYVETAKVGEDTSSPYSVSWNSATVSDCSHTLKAKATDLCGRTKEATITVGIDNTAPVITITSPAAGSTVRGYLTPANLAKVTITASATEQHGAAGTNIYVQVWHTAPGVPYMITSYSQPGLSFSTVWNTGPSDSGTTEVRVYGIDGLGNSGAASPVVRSFTVNNASFDDVAYNYWSWLYIERIRRVNVTQGCSATPPLFCPAGNVTRAQMAVFICRAKGLPPDTTPPQVFQDVPPSYWAYGYIQALYRAGITSGCTYDPISGIRNYCPEDPVTRAQMAVFLCRAISAPPISPCTGVFSDVPVGYWACGYVEKIYALGITTGCATSPLRYCPNDNIRRDQMAVFLVRTFSIGPPP